MKKLFIGVLVVLFGFVFVNSNQFYFAPREQSETISGFKYPEGTELIFKRRHSCYKIYKWRIPEQSFSVVAIPSDVTPSPFHELEWAKREYTEFGEGAESMFDESDFSPDCESVHYRTSHHAVELIRSKSESSIMIISIYNN